jgi:outer membrane autotransporter protein
LLGIRRAALATTALIPAAFMAQIAFADPVAGPMIFDDGGETSYGADITGDIDVEVRSGTVILKGMNTFTGATIISEDATLALDGQGRVNQSSGVAVNGTFDVSSASSATVNAISGAGVIEVGDKYLNINASTGSFAGNISGTGGVNINAGDLTLTGTSDVTGQFGTGAGASLKVGAGGTSGWISANVLNFGALTFDRSDGGTYSGKITGTGNIFFTGGGSYVLTGENSNSGSVSISDGTSVQLGDGGATGKLGGSGQNSGSIANDGTLIYNRSSATTYAGVISGTGDLRQIGSGRTTLNGVNSYSGGTTVEAGELLIGGTASYSAATVSGPVSVYDGAMLGGFGTINGDLTILDGGALGAGDASAIGTLSVNGDLDFAAGSRFNVKVNSGTGASDLLAVTGTATLAGSVAHIGFEGIYDPVSTYTILTAGDINGEFDDVSSDFAFLYPVLSYSETDVVLSLIRNDIEFTGITTTPNQFAVAAAVEQLGGGSPLYGAVAMLGEDEANEAFDSLSGETHASTGSFLMGNSALLRDAIGQRMRNMETQGSAGVTISSKGAPAAATTPVWVSSFGSWSDIDGDSNVEGLSGSSGGLMAGVDRQLDSGWLLGAAFGLGRSSFDLDDGSASVDSNDWHLGLYADRSWGRLTLRSGLGFTSHDVSSERDVAVGAISEQQEADYDARTVQAFGELGYRIDRGQAALEPFINLAHVRFSSDDIAEEGGVAALEISPESRSTSFATLGLRGTHDLSLQGTPARLEGAVAWRRAFGDLGASSDNSFIGGGGFTVSGADLPRDVVTLEAGLGLALAEGSDFSIGYAGQFGDGSRQDGVRATLKMRF